MVKKKETLMKVIKEGGTLSYSYLQGLYYMSRTPEDLGVLVQTELAVEVINGGEVQSLRWSSFGETWGMK